MQKNVLFTFNNDIDKHTDGVTMGSGLGPLSTGIISYKILWYQEWVITYISGDDM